jgi:hypothetical protein
VTVEVHQLVSPTEINAAATPFDPGMVRTHMILVVNAPWLPYNVLQTKPSLSKLIPQPRFFPDGAPLQGSRNHLHDWPLVHTSWMCLPYSTPSFIAEGKQIMIMQAWCQECPWD